MTKILIDRATVEQALDALEAGPDVDPIFAGETEDALRAALAEPVAWIHGDEFGDACHWVGGRMPPAGTKLYTAPPQRKPLTEEDIVEILCKHFECVDDEYIKRAAQEIAAHNIKENT